MSLTKISNKQADCLQNFKNQLKAHFSQWTVFSFPFISNAGAFELDTTCSAQEINTSLLFNIIMEMHNPAK